MPLAYSKCPPVFSVGMLLTAGVGDQKVKWQFSAAYLLVFFK